MVWHCGQGSSIFLAIGPPEPSHYEAPSARTRTRSEVRLEKDRNFPIHKSPSHQVVLHTDGARAYKLKLPELLHCNVVHKKKDHRQQEGGDIHFLVYVLYIYI